MAPTPSSVSWPGIRSRTSRTTRACSSALARPATVGRRSGRPESDRMTYIVVAATSRSPWLERLTGSKPVALASDRRRRG